MKQPQDISGNSEFISHSRMVVDPDSETSSRRLKKMREVWRTQEIVSFYLSAMEYRYAVLGWCSFLIRPHVEPFSRLKFSDKFLIKGEEGEYVCRVDDVRVFDDVTDAVTETNFRMVWPNASLLSLDRVRFLVSTQVYNNRYRQHIKKYGLPPKIMLIRYSLHKDPKD